LVLLIFIRKIIVAYALDKANENDTLGLQQSEPTITGEILESTVVQQLKSV